MRIVLSLMLIACGGDAQRAQPPEPEPLPVELSIYEEGHVVGQVSAPEPDTPNDDEPVNVDPPEEETGLTVVDLGDDYAPGIFAPAPELGALGTPPYRDVYVALADERLDALPDDVEPERFLEVFGIFPTFRVLRERLGETERHACHAAIDAALLHELPYVIKPKTVDVAVDRQRVRAYERELPRFEAERSELGVPSLEALQGVSARTGRVLDQFLRDRRRVETVRAIQAHLRCDGLLSRGVDGVADEATGEALGQWQLRHMLYSPGFVDATTIATMRVDSRELDFRAVLRALRERVVDATQVLEDGSARHEWGTILGRTIDAPELQSSAGHDARENGAADWISPATEAAARALGWTDPDAFLAFEMPDPAQVALRLPRPPTHHSAHMEIRAEIDRGELSYDLPRDVRGAAPTITRRPVLTLFAKHGEQEIALSQWPTTIGGWNREVVTGGIALQYKESPPGPRIWRDVVAAPAWIPPLSTPVDELVRYVGRDRIVPNTTLFGPGYRSAYGLAMLIHHRREESEMGAGDVFTDEGVRTHGSVSYRSILTGSSHGCHRLHNHLALRLTRFLLAHRRHVRRGSLLVRHTREIRTTHGTTTFRIPSRGYAYELTPPVEIEVLEGTIVGRRRTPDPRSHPVRAPAGASSSDE